MATQTKRLADVTDLELVTSLGGKVCPACGGGKNRKHTFCGRDYYAIPPAARQALYHRLGRGYRESIAAALATLGRVAGADDAPVFLVEDDDGSCNEGPYAPPQRKRVRRDQQSEAARVRGRKNPPAAC